MDIHPSLLFSGIAMVCVTAIGVYVFLNNRTIDRLGLEVEFDEGTFGPERPVTFRVKFQPKVDAVVKTVSARLWCREVEARPSMVRERRSSHHQSSHYRNRQHRSSTAVSRNLWEQTSSLAENLKLKACENRVLEESFELGPEVKGTKRGSNEVAVGEVSLSRTWLLMVSVRTPGGLPIQNLREVHISTP